MTFGRLTELINHNNISHDVIMMSDSGWEYCATVMNGAYYNKKDNLIVFTQSASEYDGYHNNPDFIRLT